MCYVCLEDIFFILEYYLLRYCDCYSSATASGDIIQPIASAKLTTEESFNFTFGTVEIRAKMPKGDWISSGIKTVIIIISKLTNYI